MSEEVFSAHIRVPVEFPLVASVASPAAPGWPGKVGLHECPVCWSLVLETGAQGHADWHAAERRRNFDEF